MSLYEEQHLELQRSARKIIETEINPHVDAWEAASIYPEHEVMGRFGAEGFQGINKPEGFGGPGLDYSFSTGVRRNAGRNRLQTSSPQPNPRSPCPRRASQIVP
jgi:citronellyl-CoA dehydrogenase